MKKLRIVLSAAVLLGGIGGGAYAALSKKGASPVTGDAYLQNECATPLAQCNGGPNLCQLSTGEQLFWKDTVLPGCPNIATRQ